MDRLLVEVGRATATLDSVLERYSTSVSSTLFLVKSHVNSLRASIENIQQWLHLTEPTSRAEIMLSLHDATMTVNAAVIRLQYDLYAFTKKLPDPGGEQQPKHKVLYDEGRMRSHLVDIQECVSLAQFALNVCQLPTDKKSELEVKDLQLGAKILSRAHASTTRQDRAFIIRSRMSVPGQDHSSDFEAFMQTIVIAERDVSADYGFVPSSSRQVFTAPEGQHPEQDETPPEPESAFSPVDTIGPDLEENTFNTMSSRRRSTLSRHTSSSSLLSMTPLNSDAAKGLGQGTAEPFSPVQRSSTAPEISLSSTQQLQRQVARKPLDLTSNPESSNSPISTSGQSALEARQRDALLAISPMSGLPARRLRSESSTSHLFREASGSLNSLTEDMHTVGLEGDTESPPPYMQAQTIIPPITDMLKPRDNPTTPPADEDDDLTAFQAVRENRPLLLRNLLDLGSGLEDVDIDTNRTLLMEAASLRRGSLIKIILHAGGRVHLKDPNGWTALHFAALRGDSQSCDILLEGGAQLEEYSTNGVTPLHLAARGGHTDAVNCLLNSWTVQKGNSQTLLTAFYEACKSDNVATAKAFIDKGVKRKTMREPWRPIAYAAESGSIPMLDFMINQKWSIKDKSPDGWTTLHFAARSGHGAMVEKLLALKVPWKSQTKKSEETALHLATIAGQTSTALALMMHKDSNVTIKDVDGQQPLHHAVRNGDLGLITALLNRGAKLEDMNKYGWQPIHIAAAYGHLPLVADFITRGVNVDEKLGSVSFNPGKRTNEAARKGYWAEIRWPHTGARPLHLALEFGYDEVANLLIAGGAKIEIGDSNGWRPLHYAAFNCRSAMVSLLLERGAGPHATTDDKTTALGLGFRGPGLDAKDEEKQYVSELLQSAMDISKRSKFKKLANFMTTSHTKSRVAEARNRAWHTAELAAALYKDYELERWNDEGDSQFALSESSHQLVEADEFQLHRKTDADTVSSSSRLRK